MGQKLSAHQIAADTIKRMFGGVIVEVNGSNPTYQLDILSGGVGADDGSDFIEVGATITVDIAVPGVNGLDAGSEAPSTWYYLWLIKDPAAGTEAGLLSLSTSAPTMPGSYTKKRLIGAVYNDSGSNFVQFSQVEKRVQYQDSQLAFPAAPLAPPFAPVPLAPTIPPIARVASISVEGVITGGAADAIVFISNSITAATGIRVLVLEFTATPTMEATTALDVVTDPSQAIFIADNGGVSTGTVYVHGFVLNV